MCERARNSAILTLLVLAACGGSGRGSESPPDLALDELTGTYFRQSLEEPRAGVWAHAAWGTVTANGGGLITGGMVTTNAHGAVLGPQAAPPVAYLIDGDRELTLYGSTTRRGGITADGRVSVLGVFSDTDSPGVEILLRRAGAFSSSSLLGNYHLCAMFKSGSANSTWWGGTVTFDGAGTVTSLNTGSNVDGAITLPGVSFPGGTYTVGSDGTVAWTSGAPGYTLRGGMLGDGAVVVLSGATDSPDFQALVVLIREGSGLSDATFGGVYHEIEISSNNAPPPYYSCAKWRGVADGAGSYSAGDGLSNTDGSIAPSLGAFPAAYSVGANGALSMSGGMYRGGVSPEGDFAAVGGQASAPGAPSLRLFVR